MPRYYLLDEHKNMVEGFDKEGFLALLEQAIEDGSLENIDEDSAVASKFRSVLNGTTHHIEFVTQAQYNQLVASGQLVANTYYFITDDATEEGLEQAIATINTALNDHNQRINDNADHLDEVDGRLDALGFKTGIATSPDIALDMYSQSLIKQGKMALFGMTSVSRKNVSTTEDGLVRIVFPDGFKPQQDTDVRVISTAIRNMVSFTADLVGTLETDGTLYITLPHNSQYSTQYFGFSIINAGWRLA